MKTILSIIIITTILLSYLFGSYNGKNNQHKISYKRGLVSGIAIGKMVYEPSDTQAISRSLYQEQVKLAEKLFIKPNTIEIVDDVVMSENIIMPENIAIEIKDK